MLTPNSKVEFGIAYHRCYAPTGTNDDELVRAAGAGRLIEGCFHIAELRSVADTVTDVIGVGGSVG
ncbi:hypothetical protein [Nocardia brevicatena]|uniref:hypothetical protein n=1 Tax=Nocardia brevicatena TaxID=37327 RepID=UPI000314B123|nr:hypothetical protein [Nocardia brevicatena]